MTRRQSCDVELIGSWASHVGHSRHGGELASVPGSAPGDKEPHMHLCGRPALTSHLNPHDLRTATLWVAPQEEACTGTESVLRAAWVGNPRVPGTWNGV